MSIKLVNLPFQISRDLGELGEGGLMVFDDFDGEIFLCLRALVFLKAFSLWSKIVLLAPSDFFEMRVDPTTLGLF